MNRIKYFFEGNVAAPHRAFTLAEVLITLGIIGVVSSMTLPIVIANYKKVVYVNQLKKAVSVLEQAFIKMLAEEDAENLEDLSGFKSLGSSPYASYVFGGMHGAKFEQYLKQYLNIVSIGKFSSREFSYLTNKGVQISSYSGTIYFKDGSMLLYPIFYPQPQMKSSEDCLLIKSKGGKLCSYQGVFYIDVNGDRRPNKAGRDIFKFYLSTDGHLFPYGGKDASLYDDPSSDGTGWRNKTYLCGEVGKAIDNSKAVTGDGCAARIIENSWKMDY